MTSTTQIVLLLLVVALVAGIAYRAGRTSRDAAAAPTSSVTPIVQSSTATRPRPAATAPASRPAAMPPRVTPARPAATAAPQGVRTWGYQLQKANLARLAESPFDLIVIDYAKDGGDDSAFKPADLARLKQKPDGSRRIVLAYLSIGEAESYRGYWQSDWKKNKPGWLLEENPEWEENYAVCFWDPGWQAIMLGSPQARLDRVLAAGFDGVYLDKCDVYEDMRAHRMPAAKARPDLEGDMVAFVTRISTYAKAKKRDFLVIMQNTEDLLERTELRRVLDGSAKEELVYGESSPEKKNPRESFEWSRERLDLMKRDGKLVLAVEYLDNPSKITDAVSTLTALGYTPYVAAKNRELDKLHSPPPIA